MDRIKTGFRLGKNKVEVLKILGEVKHNNRTYRLVRVRITSGEEYLSLRLYNAKGKFIKQFMMEPEVTAEVASLLNLANISIADEMARAEALAWKSLAKYKFMMFGYWSAIWVHLNRISGLKKPNPFQEAVKHARAEVESEKLANRFPHLFED